VTAKKKSKSRKAGLKDKGILIRVTGTQKRELASAAKSAGLGLSSWMLTVSLIAAQEARWKAEARREKMRRA
jgi:uncharacterized protein (DUF1778 family)